MSARLAAFRDKARLRFRRGYMLPPWTKAEVDDIMRRARAHAEEIARYVS